MKIRFRRLGVMEQRIALLSLLMATGFIFLFSELPDQIAAMEKRQRYEGEFYRFAQLFSEIHSEIESRYVGEADEKALYEGAIRGMFAALGDPHSQWLPPESLQQLEKETEGEFSGVGLQIQLDDNGILTAVSPIPGSPAARAGMHAWDRIIEIDGVTTENITLLEAVKKLTGPTGTSVGVKVYREGEPDYLSFTIVRDTIKVQSVYHRIMDDKIGYLRLTKFAEHTAEEVEEALREFKKEKVEGLIVDLRYNSGGLLDKVVTICDYFLPAGQIVVSTKGRQEENNREFHSRKDPICEVPMIVLVNKGSASASEIFAGAMQDTRRGFILGPEGENTFGKGSVQTISYLNGSLDLKDNGQPALTGLRLTTAKYYTPSGRTIDKVGVTPDFTVALSREHRIELLRHGLEGDPTPEEHPVPAPAAGKTDEDPDSDEDAPEAEAGPEEGGAVHLTPFGKTAPVEDAKKDTFRDIQLDEGVKYLKIMLRMKS